MPPTHNSGQLKQSNKKHKGKSLGKRARKRSFGAGKVQSQGGVKGTHSAAALSKANRINSQRQKHRDKRQEIWLARRIGSPTGPPKMLGLLSLSVDANVGTLLDKCVSAADWSLHLSPYQINATYTGLKCRVSYLLAREPDEMLSQLDLAKAVDCLLLYVHVKENCQRPIIDDDAVDFLAALRSAGMPEIIVCVDGLKLLKGKILHDTKRKLQQILDAAIYTGNC